MRRLTDQNSKSFLSPHQKLTELSAAKGTKQSFMTQDGRCRDQNQYIIPTQSDHGGIDDLINQNAMLREEIQLLHQLIQEAVPVITKITEELEEGDSNEVYHLQQQSATQIKIALDQCSLVQVSQFMGGDDMENTDEHLGTDSPIQKERKFEFIKHLSCGKDQENQLKYKCVKPVYTIQKRGKLNDLNRACKNFNLPFAETVDNGQTISKKQLIKMKTINIQELQKLKAIIQKINVESNNINHAYTTVTVLPQQNQDTTSTKEKQLVISKFKRITSTKNADGQPINILNSNLNKSRQASGLPNKQHLVYPSPILHQSFTNDEIHQTLTSINSSINTINSLEDFNTLDEIKEDQLNMLQNQQPQTLLNTSRPDTQEEDIAHLAHQIKEVNFDKAILEELNHIQASFQMDLEDLQHECIDHDEPTISVQQDLPNELSNFVSNTTKGDANTMEIAEMSTSKGIHFNQERDSTFDCQPLQQLPLQCEKPHITQDSQTYTIADESLPRMEVLDIKQAPKPMMEYNVESLQETILTHISKLLIHLPADSPSKKNTHHIRNYSEIQTKMPSLSISKADIKWLSKEEKEYDLAKMNEDVMKRCKSVQEIGRKNKSLTKKVIQKIIPKDETTNQLHSNESQETNKISMKDSKLKTFDIEDFNDNNVKKIVMFRDVITPTFSQQSENYPLQGTNYNTQQPHSRDRLKDLAQGLKNSNKTSSRQSMDNKSPILVKQDSEILNIVSDNVQFRTQQQQRPLDDISLGSGVDNSQITDSNMLCSPTKKALVECAMDDFIRDNILIRHLDLNNISSNYNSLKVTPNSRNPQVINFQATEEKVTIQVVQEDHITDLSQERSKVQMTSDDEIHIEAYNIQPVPQSPQENAKHYNSSPFLRNYENVPSSITEAALLDEQESSFTNEAVPVECAPPKPMVQTKITLEETEMKMFDTFELNMSQVKTSQHQSGPTLIRYEEPNAKQAKFKTPIKPVMRLNRNVISTNATPRQPSVNVIEYDVSTCEPQQTSRCSLNSKGQYNSLSYIKRPPLSVKKSKAESLIRESSENIQKSAQRTVSKSIILNKDQLKLKFPITNNSIQSNLAQPQLMIIIPNQAQQQQVESRLSSRQQSQSTRTRVPSSIRNSNSKEHIMKVQLNKDIQNELKQNVLATKIKEKEDKIQNLIIRKKQQEDERHSLVQKRKLEGCATEHRTARSSSKSRQIDESVVKEEEEKSKSQNTSVNSIEKKKLVIKRSSLSGMHTERYKENVMSPVHVEFQPTLRDIEFLKKVEDQCLQRRQRLTKFTEIKGHQSQL